MAFPQGALVLAKKMTASATAGDLAGALDCASDGAEKFPALKLPIQGQDPKTWPKFADMGKIFRAKLEEEIQAKLAAATVPAKVEVPDESDPTDDVDTVDESDDGPEVDRDLQITHTVAEGTVLHGTSPGSGMGEIMGRKGLGWWFFAPKGIWYIRGTKGYASDKKTLAMITAAVSRLEDEGYNVTSVVDDTDAETGKPALAKEAVTAQRKATKAAAKPAPMEDLGLGAILAMAIDPPAKSEKSETSKARRATVKAGVSEIDGDDAALVWVARLSATANGRHTATALRSDLSARVASLYEGLEFEVRYVKGAKVATVKVKSTPPDLDVALLGAQVRGTMLTVRGVAAATRRSAKA